MVENNSSIIQIVRTSLALDWIVTDLYFFLGEANDRQGLHHNFPIVLVTDGAESGTVALNKTIQYYITTDGTIAWASIFKTKHHTHLYQIMVVLRLSFQIQRGKQIVVSSIQKLIEDVEVPLTVVLVHYTGFFQQVVQDVTAHWCPLGGVTENS